MCATVSPRWGFKKWGIGTIGRPIRGSEKTLSVKRRDLSPSEPRGEVKSVAPSGLQEWVVRFQGLTPLAIIGRPIRG